MLKSFTNNPDDSPFVVYILVMQSGSTYVGQTKNWYRRFNQHASTRVELVVGSVVSTQPTRKQALEIEKFISSKSKEEKINLFKTGQAKMRLHRRGILPFLAKLLDEPL